VKNLKRDLQAVNKELRGLVKKTENLMKAVDRIDKAQSAKITPVGKPGKPVKRVEEPTAYATFLSIISKSRKGLSVEQLMTKTGFGNKKIANLVYKAKKQGKIKNVGKGVYMKA
jgi:hypothetical protein